jgi:hypothetical protein
MYRPMALGAEATPTSDGHSANCFTACDQQFKGSGLESRCTNVCIGTHSKSECGDSCRGEFSNLYGRRSRCTTACNASYDPALMSAVSTSLAIQSGAPLPLPEGASAGPFGIPPMFLIGGAALVALLLFRRRST